MKSRKLDYANFGKRLRARRLQMKITQIELGKQTGLTASYIGHLEKGYRAPSADALISLCNALKISPDFLLQDYMTFGQTPMPLPEFSQSDLDSVMKVIKFIRETGVEYDK